MVFPSYGKVKFGGKYLIKISKDPTFPRAILFLSNVLYHEGLANSHLHFLRILNILLSLQRKLKDKYNSFMRANLF